MTTTTNTTSIVGYTYQPPSEAAIKENARFITEFMDIKVKYVDLSRFQTEKSFWMIDHDSKPVDNHHYSSPTSFRSKEDCLEGFISSIRYHESFDWIMSVVKKIESLTPNPNSTYQQPL